MTSQSSSLRGISLFRQVRGGASDPLSVALNALTQGRLDDCIQTLGRQVGQARRGPDPWDSRDLEQLRCALVHQRDAGDMRGAEEGLRLARAVWPDYPSFATELLVIYQHQAFGTPQRVQQLKDGLSDAIALAPQNRLLTALLSAREGDGEGARSALRQLRGCPDEALHAYPDEFVEAVRLAFVTDPAAAAGQMQDPALVIEGLVILFLHADDAGSLNMVVRKIGLLDIFGLENAHGLTIEALQSVASQLSIDGKSTLVAILTAFDRYPEARLLIDHLLQIEDSRTSVLFAKSAVAHAMRTRAFALERHVLGRFIDRDRPENDDLHLARRREILNRRAALAADKPLNIFIGFFGQSRASDQVMPDTIRGLNRDFAVGMGGPFNLHYGLSTWNRSGSRSLQPSDPSAFFAQVLPRPLHPLLAARFGSIGADLSNAWPATISATISFMNDKAQEQISAATFHSILPPTSSLVIGDEDQLEEQLRAVLAAKGQGPDIPEINQYKMWSRISTLREALLEQEARTGRKMDACLILRSDIQYLGGKPANIMCRASSEMERSCVFCDHDPHAEYIEGAGDRYLAFSRHAADVVFSGFDYLLRATRQDDHSGDLLRRRRGHEGLHSLIFSHGLTAKPMANINYGLHRGRVPTEILMPALRQDAARTSHPDHRALIDQVLLDLAATA